MSTSIPNESPAPQILIVENETGAQMLLRILLEANYDLAFAPDVETAMDRALHAPFDLVLIDISLGGPRNGVDLLERLRAEPVYVNTPLIALTAHAMPGDRDRFLAAGFDAYVAKPFTQRELNEVLEQHLTDVPRPG